MESDFQRLDERINLPAQAELNNIAYSVINLSRNGACLSGIDELSGNTLKVKLSINVDDFKST